MEVLTTDGEVKYTDYLKHYSVDFIEGNYIDEKKFYFCKFGLVPCILNLTDVDEAVFIDWLADAHKDDIERVYKREKVVTGGISRELRQIIFVLRGRNMICINDDFLSILYDLDTEEFIKPIVSHAKKLQIIYREEPKISLVVEDVDGYRMLELKCPEPDIDFTMHYNDDFADIHKQMQWCLKATDMSGIHLLHGTPGTGKTTFIRYLIHRIKKRFIFLTPRLAGNLDSPGILKMLIDYPNSVLVIEDAEDLLLSRENANNSAISMLLNLSDGIFSDSLNIQAICTFNTSIGKTDKALLRKGRLLSMYEFKALPVEKANMVLETLDTEVRVYKPTTLANLFHHDTKDYDIDTTRPYIGFKLN